MEKILKVSQLLDLYGALLTDHQREVLRLYYYEDLSLIEIADIYNITRQGVRDSLKKAEQKLFELEKILNLANVQLCLFKINSLAKQIIDVLKNQQSQDGCQKLDILDFAERIKNLSNIPCEL